MLLKPNIFTHWQLHRGWSPWETEMQGGGDVAENRNERFIFNTHGFKFPDLSDGLIWRVLCEWASPEEASHARRRHEHPPPAAQTLQLCAWPPLVLWGDLQSDFPVLCHSSGYRYIALCLLSLSRSSWWEACSSVYRHSIPISASIFAWPSSLWVSLGLHMAFF